MATELDQQGVLRPNFADSRLVPKRHGRVGRRGRVAELVTEADTSTIDSLLHHDGFIHEMAMAGSPLVLSRPLDLLFIHAAPSLQSRSEDHGQTKGDNGNSTESHIICVKTPRGYRPRRRTPKNVHCILDPAHWLGMDGPPRGEQPR
jgi:hypothetical protein